MEQEALTLLVNGEAAFPEILHCIEHAKSSVEINMFIWRDDEIGNRMAEAVLHAAERGVNICIPVDRYGVVLEKCEESMQSFFHKTQSWIEKAKINTLKQMYPENCRPRCAKDEYSALYTQIMTHPNIRVQADKFKADHSKYYIIDDKKLFLGGINIEDKENGCDLSGRVYGDYMVKLNGEEYVNAFRTKLNTGENILDNIFFGTNRKEPVRRFEMEQLYLDLISHAKTELHITMAYFSPIKRFTKAIVDACSRGVQVTVVIPEKANFQNDSNRRTVRKLLKETDGKIAVYLSPKMLRTKLVMNEQLISLGSTNITKKAFCQLDELNLFVKNTDSAFRKVLTASIDKDIKGARHITNYRDIAYRRLRAWTEGFLV